MMLRLAMGLVTVTVWASKEDAEDAGDSAVMVLGLVFAIGAAT